MMDLVLLGAGTALGVGSMLPVGIVLWRSGKVARWERDVTAASLKAERTEAESAKRSVIRLSRELSTANRLLQGAVRTIGELEPLVALGRARKAAIDAESAKKRAARAARRGK